MPRSLINESQCKSDQLKGISILKVFDLDKKRYLTLNFNLDGNGQRQYTQKENQTMAITRLFLKSSELH